MDLGNHYEVSLVPREASAARRFIAEHIDDPGEEWSILQILGLDR